MGKSWFVGLVKYGKEFDAAEEARKTGYCIRLPKRHVRLVVGKKAEARTTLRFRGYIFFEADPDKGELGPINHVRYMDDSSGSAIVGGFKTCALRPGYLEMLERISDLELREATAKEARPDIRPGDFVQIIGDRNSAAYGRSGVLGDIQRGICEVWEGVVKWKVPECDLKKIEPQEQKRAA
jgi:hypothetical protein